MKSMNKSSQLTNKIQEYLFYFFLLTLSFPIPILKWTYGLWFVACILNLILRPKLVKENLVFGALLLALFLVRLVSAIIHNDFKFFISEHFDTQLTFLAFPFILFFNKFESISLSKILKLLVLGNILAMIVFIVEFILYRFHILVLKDDIYNFFPSTHSFLSLYDEMRRFQDSFTVIFKHRAAMGFCSSISLAALFYLIKDEGHLNVKVILYLLAILFCAIFLYLTGSRSGLISAGVLSVVGAIYLLKDNKTYLLISLISIVISFSVLSTLKSTRNLMLKELVMFDYSKIRLLDPRFQIWETSAYICSSHLWSGVGMSNIKPTLNDEYVKRGYVFYANEGFNTHNQFMHFCLESGVIASILFVSLLLFLLYVSENKFITSCFVFSFTILSLFEDSLIQINSICAFVIVILSSV
jgi:O-antigen ligase